MARMASTEVEERLSRAMRRAAQETGDRVTNLTLLQALDQEGLALVRKGHSDDAKQLVSQDLLVTFDKYGLWVVNDPSWKPNEGFVIICDCGARLEHPIELGVWGMFQAHVATGAALGDVGHVMRARFAAGEKEDLDA